MKNPGTTTLTNSTGMHPLVGITMSIAVEKKVPLDHLDHRNVERVIPGIEISI
jgi:hypothetical protein